ncbi:MAG TPA: sensor histidine kinase [Dehalococcoidia bacterium]|nr:sensor histidine kinase [Dehalococcoidia bacterium]
MMSRSELGRLARNVHFWIILIITAAIAIIYYEWSNWFPWFWRYFVFEFANELIGSLFFIPFLYASLVFWWRGSLFVWVLSQAAVFPLLLYYRSSIEDVLINVALSFVPLTAVMIITMELKWRERQRQIMVERERERQVYMSEIFRAQENERQRIAQELHDDTTQELLVIANRAQNLVSGDHGQSSPMVREQAEWIRDAVLKLSENVRRLSLDLRPSVLDDIGLVPAVRWLADRLNQEDGINTKVVVSGQERKLRPEAEVTIFRIIQEALNNVRRHSQASEAVVTLDFAPQSLKITVQDNGNGFSLKETLSSLASKGKLGLIGVQQRARLLNGTCVICSQPGEGTSVSVEIAG